MRKKFLYLLPAVALILQTTSVHASGVGFFSNDITWSYSNDLYYSVGGGPANTCGDLWTSRNGGAWQEGPGWICTDSNGNATKGPWTWANQAGDETAYAYIEWPNGSTTTVDSHIWDKTCAATTENVNGAPPTSFSGGATDAAWGAGFNAAWTSCSVGFFDITAQKHWDAATDTYTSTNGSGVGCTISGMPGFSVTWSAHQVPSVSAHTSGHCYVWFGNVDDGACSTAGSHYFCT